MENSVNYYLLDITDDWDNWGEVEKNALALWVMQEWICSANFKWKATHSEVLSETTMGQKYLAFMAEDQFWKDDEYQRIKKLVNSVLEYWNRKKWVCEETTKNGRPRRAEYSRETISKAMRYLNPPFQIEDSEEDTLYKSVNWSRSVLGETTTQRWVRLVVLKDCLFKEIYKKCGVEYFTGSTKEEIAQKLNLSKSFVNEMCRWLQDSGTWKVVRCERKGVTRREMRYSVL